MSEAKTRYEKEHELTVCYAIIDLQSNQIRQLQEKIKHLEQLLTHKAHLLDKED